MEDNKQSFDRLDWHQYFMAMVHLTAMRSPDQSTKVGAVIVGKDLTILSCGYNGTVRGIHCDEANGPAKYDVMEHAERNAIYNAGRNGVRLEGSTLYTTAIPCINCARAVIQSGIRDIIFDNDCARIFEQADKEGKYGFETSKSLLTACRVGYTGINCGQLTLQRMIRGQIFW